MARRARAYTRDNRGRFASSPGGGPKAKPKPRTSFRQRQAVSLARSRGQTGRLGSATKAAKARLKATKARTGAGASPQQKAALTRAKRMASMLAGERRVKTAGKAGVIKGRVRRDPGVRAKLGAVKRKTIQGEQARKDRAEMATDRKKWSKQLLAMPKAARRAIQTENTARRSGLMMMGDVSRAVQDIAEGRMRLAHNFGKRKDRLSPRAINAITQTMQQSADKLRKLMAKETARRTRPTSKVVPRSERRRVTGPRKAGVIAKPKGLKPGALAERRAKRFPRSMRGRNVDKNAAYMAFMDRAQALPTKRKNRNDYNQKRATTSRGTAVRAQQYIEKWMKPRYYS